MPNSNRDRNRRVLKALKSLDIENLPEDDDTPPEDDADGGDDVAQPVPPVPIFAPPAEESETQRKLRKTKVRKSLDQEIQEAFGQPPTPR